MKPSNQYIVCRLMKILIDANHDIVLHSNQYNQLPLELYLDIAKLHLIEKEINISNYYDRGLDIELESELDRGLDRRLDRIINTTVNNKNIIDANIYLLLMHTLPFNR